MKTSKTGRPNSRYRVYILPLRNENGCEGGRIYVEVFVYILPLRNENFSIAIPPHQEYNVYILPLRNENASVTSIHEKSSPMFISYL